MINTRLPSLNQASGLCLAHHKGKEWGQKVRRLYSEGTFWSFDTSSVGATKPCGNKIQFRVGSFLPYVYIFYFLCIMMFWHCKKNFSCWEVPGSSWSLEIANGAAKTITLIGKLTNPEPYLIYLVCASWEAILFCLIIPGPGTSN